MCYNLLILKKKNFKWLKKGGPNYLHFIDLEGQVSSAYVPVRDQNLVVRGQKNWRLIGCVFFISLKKVLKWKKPSGKMNLFVFFILEKKKTWSMFK
jgi:hypothetical protein